MTVVNNTVGITCLSYPGSQARIWYARNDPIHPSLRCPAG